MKWLGCGWAEGDPSFLPGIGLCLQPLYIGEAAPKHLRGMITMGSSVFLTGGILTGQIVGLRWVLLTHSRRGTCH